MPRNDTLIFALADPGRCWRADLSDSNRYPVQPLRPSYRVIALSAAPGSSTLSARNLRACEPVVPPDTPDPAAHILLQLSRSLTNPLPSQDCARRKSRPDRRDPLLCFSGVLPTDWPYH